MTYCWICLSLHCQWDLPWQWNHSVCPFSYQTPMAWWHPSSSCRRFPRNPHRTSNPATVIRRMSCMDCLSSSSFYHCHFFSSSSPFHPRHLLSWNLSLCGIVSETRRSLAQPKRLHPPETPARSNPFRPVPAWRFAPFRFLVVAIETGMQSRGWARWLICYSLLPRHPPHFRRHYRRRWQCRRFFSSERRIARRIECSPPPPSRNLSCQRMVCSSSRPVWTAGDAPCHPCRSTPLGCCCRLVVWL
mmetsp:Transcript_14431/g.31368  ORF Transcript_14431/g.31368 Transcript_14431/m.31368 type:complete len:245 (-) Transcript_14431:236-970(-)